jgi:hypothetical protein
METPTIESREDDPEDAVGDRDPSRGRKLEAAPIAATFAADRTGASPT